MMTEDQLRAIEARAEAAPKGPYWASTEADGPSLNNGNVLRRDESGDLCVILQANHYFQPTFPLLDFVAEARQDIPALVAEVRRLRAQVDALESALRESIEALEDSHYLVAGEFPNTPSEHPKVPRLTAILNGESEGAHE